MSSGYRGARVAGGEAKSGEDSTRRKNESDGTPDTAAETVALPETRKPRRREAVGYGLVQI